MKNKDTQSEQPAHDPGTGELLDEPQDVEAYEDLPSEEEEAPKVDVRELEAGPMLNAHGLPHIKDVLNLLHKDVKERHISWLPGKTDSRTGKQGAPIPYIAWPTACDYMDHFAVWWDYSIVGAWETEKYVVVQTRVVIHHSNGECPRDGLGWELKGAAGYGGPYANAESQSLRRALAKFGLARKLYQKGQQPPPPAEVVAAFRPASGDYNGTPRLIRPVDRPYPSRSR